MPSAGGRVGWSSGLAKGLQHGFGVTAVSAGIPLNRVQRWLGHAQLPPAIYANAGGELEQSIAGRMRRGERRVRDSQEGAGYIYAPPGLVPDFSSCWRIARSSLRRSALVFGYTIFSPSKVSRTI